jgi:tRNA(adenine34) deaminase
LPPKVPPRFNSGFVPVSVSRAPGCYYRPVSADLKYDFADDSDRAMMVRALDAAREAGERGEIPVGAVVARGEEIVAVAANEREASNDPTAHAEVLALRRAAEALGSWRLTGCTLYATLEPCPMCAGAAHSARVSRLVYAAPDPKAGAAGTLYDLPSDERLNHTFPVFAGLLEAESSELLRSFFRQRRKRPPGTPHTSPRRLP